MIIYMGSSRFLSNEGITSNNGFISIGGTSSFLNGDVVIGTTSSSSKLDVKGVITATGGNSTEWNTSYDNKINSISYDTSNGIITFNQQGGSTLTVDIDGRYALLGSTQSSSSSSDADSLEGQDGAYYLDWGNTTNKPDTVITLGGDLGGSVSLTNLANGTLTATIQSSSVEGSMLNNNVISSQTGLTSGLEGTDEFLISNSGVLNRMGVSVLTNYMQSNLTFTTNTDTNYYLDGISRSGNTLTFFISGATNQTYPFGALGFLDTVDSNLITDNSVGADELNVTGNGTAFQYLRSDGDGSFTWAAPTGTTYSNSTSNIISGGTFQRAALTGDITASQNSNSTELHVSSITGKNALTSGLEDTDEFLISNSGVLNRMDVSVLTNYMQSNLTFTTNTNYYLDNITRSSNTLTFSVNGTTDRTFEFGANAFNSIDIINSITYGDGTLTTVITEDTDVILNILGIEPLIVQLDENTFSISHIESNESTSTYDQGNVIQNVQLDDWGHVTRFTSIDLDTRFLRPNVNENITSEWSFNVIQQSNSSLSVTTTSATVDIGIGNNNYTVTNSASTTGTVTINLPNPTSFEGTMTITMINDNSSGTGLSFTSAGGGSTTTNTSVVRTVESHDLIICISNGSKWSIVVYNNFT